MAEAVRGLVDAGGNLTRADARLADLQEAAGGRVGGVLAVPALASLARLAQSLAVMVSRSIVVAEGDDDLDLFVRATPEGTSVVLEISGWETKSPRQPRLLPTSDATGSGAESALPKTIQWSVDAALVLSRCDGLDETAVGRPLTQIFHLIDNAGGEMPILPALAARADFTGQRATLVHDPSREVALEGLVLRDLDGRFAGYIGTAHAVTAQPADEQPDDDAAAAFIGRLDSALRPPLTRIAARADKIGMQSEGSLRRDYTDYAGDIGIAARHLLSLIDDLADLRAIENAGFTVDAEAIDLADVARRVAGLLQVRAADRGVRIDRPAERETLAASGDFRRTLQIVVNLVGNAIRYSPEGSQIWLRLEHDADTVVLIVADQGKGIAADDQGRIFEKFGRVDPAESEGSGLGLYISRRLARAMGGDITVDSAPGHGARFMLTLPAA